MVALVEVERWVRHHVNGWRAEAIRDEHGHWAAAARPAGQGSIVSMVGDFELARFVAESRIPRHQCSEWTCGPWIRNSTAGDTWVTPDRLILVQASFSKVASRLDAVGPHFYQRLFDIDPSLRLLFRGNISTQGRKLTAMVEFFVRELDRIDTLLPIVQALGVRHAHYGVRENHYDSFGAAWLWTLAQELRADFTPEVKDAWLAVYTLLANAMKESAAEVDSPRL